MFEALAKFFEKSKNVKRDAYVWNAISATMLAMQSPIILMVLQRTNGTEDAGIFSIAIAIANLMMYVGQYGLRRFQASDIREQYSFNEYHGMRVITCFALVMATLGYCVFGRIVRGYSMYKFVAIFMVCMIRLIQAYSDVYHGNMQQKGRLDVVGKVTAFRYFMEMAVLCVMVILTRDLVLSTAVSAANSVFLMLLTTCNVSRHYCTGIKPVFHASAIKGLIIDGFPLFISMFLNTYVGNAPKYAIDAYLTDDIQAIFTYIFMPAFVVQIVAQFIFNPIITEYADLWLAHSRESFGKLMKRIRKMYVLILLLLVVGLAVAATIGIPVLSFVFGVDLSPYRKELCIIMLGGGMLAFATYFSTIIAIIRVQRSLIACYGIVSVAALLLSGTFVAGGGMTGASWMYVMLMSVLAVALFIAMTLRLNREKESLK